MTSKNNQPTDKNKGKKPSKTDEDNSDGEKTGAFNLNNLLDDPESFARNASDAVNEMGNVAAAIFKPIEKRGSELDASDRFQDFFSTIAAVGKHWAETPEKSLEAQTRITKQYMELWASSMTVSYTHLTLPTKA